MRSARLLSAGLMFSLLSGLVAVLPPLAQPAAAAAAEPSPVAPVKSAPKAVGKPDMPVWQAPAVSWPAGGSGETVVGGALARIGGPAPVGGLQVSVDADDSDAVSVQGVSAAGQTVALNVLPKTAPAATAAKGVVFTAATSEPLAGPVKLTVSYAGFGAGYGAGWGSRLRLVWLPACALTTPALPQCQEQTEVPGWVNNPVAQTVSAPVAVPALTSTSTQGASAQSASTGSEPQVFALTAGASSESGDFKASTLNPAASWLQGGAAGDYTMSVPVKMPPVPGLSPSVSLNYSSGAVDGLTKSTNTQASPVGEGWSLGGVSFVERAYRPCKDDGGPATSGDLCYVSDAPVSVVLNGKSSQLYVDTSGKWFAEDGSLGWRVERLTGAGNGVQGGEYFKITTMDGTQYLFGSRPHGATGVLTAGGAMRMPVFFHDEPTSPCYSSQGFQYSYCPDKGWRWNLDYVVDRFGNTMTYNYQYFSGKYTVAETGPAVEYDLSQQLMSIEFGANATSGVLASGQVAFTYAYRCTDPSTAVCDANKDAARWPDTPWDQFCYLWDSVCPGRTSPTFWTPFRLAKIETRAYDGTEFTGPLTDQLNLGHIFPLTGDYVAPAGDDTPPSLWMQTLTRQNGESVFSAGGKRLVNRVFWGDDLARAPMNHYRIDNVYWGTGAHTSVSYSGEECTRTNVYDGRADHNVLRCYPQWEVDQFRWYHKYVVAQVTDDEQLAGSPPVVTRYNYTFDHVTSTQGQEYANAMWHFDDDYLLPMARRTYSEWRGYPVVLTSKGNADGTGLQTLSQDVYFRGMDADRSGTTWGGRDSKVNDGTITYEDEEGKAGKLLRHTTFDTQNGGVWRDMQITKYTADAAGTMSTNGGNPPAYYAWKTLPVQTQTILNVPGSSYTRTSTVNTSYDATYPIVIEVKDLGETQATTNPVGTADDKCTTTTYVPADITRWLIGFPKDTITTDCAATPVAGSYLSGQRFYYDSQALGVIGAGASMAKLTKTEALQKATASPPAAGDWLVTGQNTVYDTYGRPTTSLDAMGRSTVTTYTPAATARGPVTKVVTRTTGTGGLTLGTTTADMDVRFGTPSAVTDVNGKVTRAAYDWHGYLTDVWKNDRAHSSTSGITPDAHYDYVIRADKPSYVSEKLLAPNGTSQLPMTVSYVDGLMRPRRTETVSGDTLNRMVTDTLYGTTGEITQTYTVNGTGLPNTAFDTFAASSATQDSRYSYNAFGQQKLVTPYSYGTALGGTWNTTAVTDGRTTTVTPPSGGTVTTTITNAQGNTAELRQAKPGGGTLNTTYTYDRLGQLKTVKDPVNNTWTYTYDLLGRKTQTTDPDAGTSSATYLADGLTESTTDGRGQKLWAEYDTLGRKIKLHADTATGTSLAEWTYDTAVFTGTITTVKGQLASTTRKDTTGSYKTDIINYNSAYQPEKTTYTMPGFGASGADLIYTTTASYNATTTLATTVAPVAGTLQDETLTYTYNQAGVADRISSKLGSITSTLIASTQFRYDGKINSQTLGASGKTVQNVNTWDVATSRLKKSATSTETLPGSYATKLVKDYTYDPAGNITSASTDAVADSLECFQYDTLRRMTQAWTQTLGSTCGTPQKAGADPYWRTWGIDDLGNRSTEQDKNADGTVANTWTYTNGGTGFGPHQVKTVTPASGATRNFVYDTTGNMTTRTTETGAAQTLVWDKENHLQKVTEGSKVTTYIYNTDGSRLLATANDGTVTKSTLYLPDGTELEKSSSGGPILGTRYLAGVAVRDVNGLKWTITNHQGTAVAQIKADDLTIDVRQMTPYGQPRGTQPTTWLGTKGYVGGTTDTPTGLTHLGAREYDPGLGRFISRDPVFDLGNPQQWHGYSYSGGNPVTYSDPSGLNYPNDSGGNGPIPPPPAPPAPDDCSHNNPVCTQNPPTPPSSPTSTTPTPPAPAQTPAPASAPHIDPKNMTFWGTEKVGFQHGLEDLAGFISMVADVAGYIPGLLCPWCATATVIAGAVVAMLYLAAGNLAKAIAAVIGAGLSFLAGKGAKYMMGRLMSDYYVKALELTSFMKGKVGRSALAKAVQSTYHVKIDVVFSTLQGVMGQTYSLITDAMTKIS